MSRSTGSMFSISSLTSPASWASAEKPESITLKSEGVTCDWRTSSASRSCSQRATNRNRTISPAITASMRAFGTPSWSE
eukprot:2126138-Prymnesium_polylepis.1